MKKRDLRLAVLGDPVDHSLSPAMHEAALHECGLKGSYERIHAPACDLRQVVARLRTDAYDGFNVTVPHKERVAPLLDHLDGAARDIGAVNTVVARGAAELVGYNTDRSGFARIIARLEPGVPSVLVLGAGGGGSGVCRRAAGGAMDGHSRQPYPGAGLVGAKSWRRGHSSATDA